MSESSVKLAWLNDKFVMIEDYCGNNQHSTSADSIESLVQLFGCKRINKESFNLDNKKVDFLEMTSCQIDQFYHLHKQLLERKINEKVAEAKYDFIQKMESFGNITRFEIGLAVNFTKKTTITLSGRVEIEI